MATCGAPTKRLLDVRLGVADEVADRPSPCRDDLGLAAAAAVDERHGRDRAADEPPLPARRRVDELLQLGPAVRLGEDSLADGWARRSTVIQSAASRAARRRSCQVRSGSSRASRSSRPKANQRGSSSGSRRRRSATNEPARCGRGGSPRGTRVHGRDQRPAHAVESARCPARRRWPSRYSGRRARAARSERPGERGRVAGQVRQAGARAPRRGRVLGDERDGRSVIGLMRRRAVAVAAAVAPDRVGSASRSDGGSRSAP